ncbi:MAG: hypothetical protein Greene041619_541 [Candidatus Peregrinibacteria bacterium Greene0416_19]|nr:MAG: hypothetical protein Greene041619_541 [Candidatus Peregrinibacteria bacterium Greene0416_19]
MSAVMSFPNVAIELIPDLEQGGFTAHIPDIPAYGEGETEEEAIADLKVGLQAFIEENGMQAALDLINSPSQLREMNFGELVAHG